MSNSTAATKQPAPLRADNNVTVRFEEVTPEQAAAYLSRNKLNRAMRSAAVEAYARDLERGFWQVTGESIKFDWNGNLLDGQHRLAAVVRSGVTTTMLVAEGLDPSVQQVIDVNVRRSAGDALRLLGIEVNVMELASVARIAIMRDRGQLTLYGSASALVSHADIHRWAIDHPEAQESVAYARRVFIRLGGSPSPVGYAIWRLEQISAEDTMTFFDSLVGYATSGEGDPRLALLRALQAYRDTRIGRRSGAQIGLIFTAWNAWRENKTIKGQLPLTDKKNRALTIPEPI